jgi:rSAM/selenodomain-associated transferase 1
MGSHNQTLVLPAKHSRTLVIMAKAPRPGTVKTRLNQSLPLAAVIALYRCLLQDTLALARSLNDVEVAVMCPESDKGDLAHFLGNLVPVVAQKGEGLAAGLVSVFAHFTSAGMQRVIAFNSDSPHLAPSILESAFQSLSESDLVIGPTHDGGYYLVGSKAAYPTLFENDGLGTSSALERLMAHADALKLSRSLTETFYDIDVAEDLIRLAPELALAPARAPRTAQWFAEWGQVLGQASDRMVEK